MVGIVDDEKIGDKFLGFEVTNSTWLNSISFDKILITSIDSKDMVLETVLKQGISPGKVVMME